MTLVSKVTTISLLNSLVVICCYALPSALAWLPRAPLATPPSARSSLWFRNDDPPGEDPPTTMDVAPSSLVRSVNYFISRKCNYSCQFCFHTMKTSHHLPLDQAQEGLRLLQQAGTEKINFAGGEPFILPLQLGELCKTASQELGMAVSIISNGSLISEEWMAYYGQYVDVLGVSVDSFCDETNAKIGRGETINTKDSNKQIKKNQHVDRILKVREMCDKHNIRFKMNTVVNSYNWEEDMIDQVRQLDPCRWKVFQVLLLDQENMGNEQSLRDARPLVVSDDQFQSFVQRHQPHFPQLVPEDNSAMQNSYLLLDEDLRFLDCSTGAKIPGESILDVGVYPALAQAGFDHDMFHLRGGVYDWKRERDLKG
ncbi:Radical S-adenosyl methionine domain-containing protein 2 [Seminavis robusta]|uniref:Radical S-adenosyl methionine domain-containing protein 2 n=1 Tax=Seminavis robusta TaxID=568900 RepID=A0A9N8DD19_9STRA|nr:Radical S-adenosyl methionine domain-containing protein 2 [Seminavis robusta]|eukprot:Sro98_g050260.1 Radical S-adenosyl methionine domain-containing protein 2 (369) ;mRNA; r:10488-11594